MYAGIYSTITDEAYNVLWMCDNDETSDRPDQFRSLVDITSRMMGQSSQTAPKSFHYCHPFEERSFEFLDILSLTDYAAGTVNELLSRKHVDEAGTLGVKAGSHHIAHWLSRQGVGLRKSVLKIVPNSNGNFQGSRIQLTTPTSFAGLPSMDISLPF